ncbi:hypothetical protein C4573_07265 [Candidatus Woesearchaeota archaeon]|nr:MAG: hypothetical protein C4573_07265 [Candidatus Woesearchaeota archaeon]
MGVSKGLFVFIAFFALFFLLLSSVYAEVQSKYSLDLKENTAKTAKYLQKHAVMQFDHSLTEQEKLDLESNGITLLQYVPENTWIVSIANNKFVAEEKTVANIANIPKEAKVSRYIQENGVAAWARNYDEETIENYTVNLTVLFYPDIDVETAQGILMENNIELIDYAFSSNGLLFRVVADEQIISLLQEYDEIQFIDQQKPSPVALNNGLRLNLGIDTVYAAPYNYNGTGVVVAEWDSGHANHTDYATRLTYGDSSSVTSHSTHVAGTLLGDGTVNSTFRGVAPNATLISYEWWDDTSEFNSETNASLQTYDSMISTNSWGIKPSPVNLSGCIYYSGSYMQEAADLDATVRGNFGKTYIMVWAAGNDRINASGYCGQYFEYGTVLAYSSAKNIISVGAINSDDDSMTYFSSYGPTQDGRIKPDIVGPGCEQDLNDDSVTGSVYSTEIGNTYIGKCGTSMATPAVSGGIALMLEALQRTHSYTETNRVLPSTIKAIIINTANDLGNTGPDYAFGWGRMNVTSAIDIIQNDNASNNTKLFFELQTNGNGITYYQINASNQDIRVTVAWDDYPATELASVTLVNDFDIVLVAPNGTYYYPWTLDKDNPSTAATTGVDHSNNVEQVSVSNANGSWILIVNRSNIVYGPQNYSLVSNLPMQENLSLSLNSVECELNSTSWIACSAMQNATSADLLSALRINCSAANISISNVSVSLINTNNNSTLFSNLSAFSDPYWILNDTNFTMGYANYSLHVFCNSTNAIIYANYNASWENAPSLSINTTLCLVNASWINCSSVNQTHFNTTLSAIQTNCTAEKLNVANVSVMLTKNNQTVFSNLSNLTNGVWEYNTSTLLAVGNYSLTVVCNATDENFTDTFNASWELTYAQSVNISAVQCELNQTTWINCSAMSTATKYDTLSAIRTNCTGYNISISNVSVSLNSSTADLLNNLSTYSDGYWLINNTNIDLTHTNYSLSVFCNSTDTAIVSSYNTSWETYRHYSANISSVQCMVNGSLTNCSSLDDQHYNLTLSSVQVNCTAANSTVANVSVLLTNNNATVFSNNTDLSNALYVYNTTTILTTGNYSLFVVCNATEENIGNNYTAAWEITYAQSVTISALQCEINQTNWSTCNGMNLTFNDTLSAIRVNCTGYNISVQNVSIVLYDNTTNATILDNSTNYTSPYWIYNGSVAFSASANYTLTASCNGTTQNISDTETASFAVYSCVEDWSCTDWDTCTGTQTRTCTDNNACGTTYSKPAESQSCTVNTNNGGGSSGGTGTPSAKTNKTEIINTTLDLYQVAVSYEAAGKIKTEVSEAKNINLLIDDKTAYSIFLINNSINATQLNFTFRIPKEWLEENNLEASSFAGLYSFDQMKWNDAAVKKIKEDSSAIYVQMPLKNIKNVFVTLTAEQKIEVLGTDEQNAIGDNLTANLTDNNASEQNESTVDQPKNSRLKYILLWVIVLALFAVSSAGAFVIIKKRQLRKNKK